MTITTFTSATRTGQFTFGPHSKFQVADFWEPDWDPGWPDDVYPAVCFSPGGTLFNPPPQSLEVTSGHMLELLKMCSNDLGMVVIIHGYRPGGYVRGAGEDGERRFFPEVLEDFALPVQQAKTRSRQFMTAGKSLSTDPNDWFKPGTSSGGWASGLTQLMPDGEFEYPISRWGEWSPRHNHHCKAVLTSIGQMSLSALSHGTASDSFYAAYGEYGWAGAYLFPEHLRDDSPAWGWADIPMEIKRRADWGEWIQSWNPRALEVGFYLTGGGTGTSGHNTDLVYDPTVATNANRIQLHDWRLNGGVPAAIDAGFGLTPRFTDLHDPAHDYMAYTYLLNVGNTLSRLRAGNATNLVVATQYISDAATFAADAKDWLVNDLGFTDPT